MVDICMSCSRFIVSACLIVDVMLQADNQANVYGGTRTNVSTDMAVNWYITNGATAGKINMGRHTTSATDIWLTLTARDPIVWAWF